MRLRLIALYFILGTGVATAQPSRHVVLISIDGFHPDMYLDSSWPTPNLRELMKRGTYADHMLSVFPAYTYPSHTAMITGALPARSKVVFNQPKGSRGEWNWYASYIKVPTLWQALKANRLTTAAVMWPASVGADITYNVSEIWSVNHPDDRITETRKYATPGLVEEIERNATGKLDSTNMSDGFFSLDENAGRMAAYIFKTYRPAFLALHFAEVDGFEHDQGRDGDSVRLAVESNDRAIGDVLEAIDKSGEKDSTTVIIVGDHGFSTIHTIFRPNMLIKDLPVRFVAAGGSAFLYFKPSDGDLPTIESGLRTATSWGEDIVKAIGKTRPELKDFQEYKARNFQEEETRQLIIQYWTKYNSWAGLVAGVLGHIEISNTPPYSEASMIKAVTDSLNQLPEDKRKLFRIIDRAELDRMGADSAAILALAAVPGVVFSGAVQAHQTENHGPGTLIQQNNLDGVFVPTHGGHHGYDPNIPDMYTGFIATGAGIRQGGSILSLRVTDIAPLVAHLLGVDFPCPDGKLVEGILR
jgi:predicted AlkP superfamily pyrophosphatase or phosphodiesterase